MTDDLAGTLRKLTRAQRRAFELIAINLDRDVMTKTAAVLLKHGLIEAFEETLPSWPMPVTITRYYVPLPIHMEWCRMCADLPDTPKAKQRKRRA